MNKIQFKYIPLGGFFRDGLNGYIKVSTSCFDGDSEWYSDYQRIPFKDAKIGETIWWAGEHETEQQEYKKVHNGDLSNAVQPDGKTYGLFYPHSFCIVLRPKEVSPVLSSNWIAKENLCQLSDLEIGDQCVVQGRPQDPGVVFTVQELYPDTHHLHNDAGLYLLKDERGRKYFSTATQQVYRKPLPPPKLMLSQLKTGQYFTFKGHTQEYIKMGPIEPTANTYFYRDIRNQLFTTFHDCEVDPYVPF